jgi:hypothetical protein
MTGAVFKIKQRFTKKPCQSNSQKKNKKGEQGYQNE